MKEWPNFDSALQTFVMNEAKKEADSVCSEKDTPRSQFNLENVRKFSYKSELDKFQKTNPLLLGKPSFSINACYMLISSYKKPKFKEGGISKLF